MTVGRPSCLEAQSRIPDQLDAVHREPALVLGEPVWRSARAEPTTQVPLAPAAGKALDLVFVLDTTGSMGPYITAAKNSITAIAARLTQAESYDVRFGLVAYRDHPPQDTSYVIQAFALTDSLEVHHEQLCSLSAAGGGDGPEAVAAGLKASLESEWREDATKVVVLIADAPPHGLGEPGDGFPDGDPDGVDPLRVLDAMSARGITVYCVGCQPALFSYRFAVAFFVAAAERTNGEAIALDSAASLADVILGGAIQEMDLMALTDEVANITRDLRSAESAPLDEDELQGHIYASLRACGTKTRQISATRLTSNHADMIVRAPTLSSAKADLCAMGSPSTRSQTLADVRASRSLLVDARTPAEDDHSTLRSTDSYKVAYRSLSTHCDCDAPESAPVPSVSTRVDLKSETISMAQVKRLFNHGKAKGLW